MNRDLHRLYRFDALILAALTLYAVTAAHEFAHGLTCKHFDAEVHEMGLLLLYFQPAFYCNVSDAWLLPRKSQRLWVTFAGAYFELFVCALATLIWRLVEPRTWLSSLSLIVMVTSAVKTFFNLNPLIKLDGYYLLSDYLEVPNLRSRSFAYLRTAIKRLLPGAHSQETSHSSRERRIYLGYGLLAGLYSYWLLGWVAVNFASFLTRRYQGFGFVMFTALLMTVFQSPISKGLRKGVGSAAPPAKGTGQFKRVTRVIIVLAFALAVLYFGRMELSVSSEFKVLPSTNAEVRAEIEGIIDEIYVDEGAVVKKGDPIARLSDRDLRAELQIIEASLAEKSAKLKLLLAGARPEEIELARRAVETARTRRESAHSRYEEARRIQAEGLSKSKAGLAKAKERLTYASGYLEDARLLFQSKLISRQEVDKAREEAAVRGKELEQAESEMKMILADDLADVQRLQAVAEKELEEALGKLALLLAGSRPEEIEATRAEIANQEARRHHLREQLQLMKVTSPIAGVITTPKLKQRIRQLVTKGDLIATVHQLKTVTAEIVSSEREIADVQVGQRVTLKARAYPEGSFTGNVTSIAPIATKDEEGMGDRYVLVSCQIDNPSLMLKSDMTGKAKIYCGQRRIIDLLSRRIARYIRIEFWSWW
jgi:putative peptide zinc metalloprotease protein